MLKTPYKTKPERTIANFYYVHKSVYKVNNDNNVINVLTFITNLIHFINLRSGQGTAISEIDCRSPVWVQANITFY